MREAHLTELQPEVEKLKAAVGEGPEKFLEYIYKTHKPLNDKHVLKKDANANLKKAYKDAIIHYHPDKVGVEEHGSKTKVLYEEITKLLTQRYEYFKAAD